jgi:hypothetical protein
MSSREKCLSAKQNNPEELRRRIRDLEKQLREAKPVVQTKPVIEYKPIEVPVLKNGQMEKLSATVERMAKVVNDHY